MSIQEIFNKYDDDHNGLISIDEFRPLVSNEDPLVSTTNAQALFNELDTDGDGNISVTEFANFATIKAKYQMNLKQLFDKNDADHNGLISVDEFEPLIVESEPSIDRAQIPAVFKAIDTDGDGNISITEYTRFYESKLVTKYRK
jgi:Ca2+-binding EF-hand superfamily protein